MKILVVDDDMVVRISCSRILEAEGHEVVALEKASQALELLAGGGFDLLLADVMMPDIDGFELMKRARQDKPDLPVILMTGYLTPQVNQRGQQAGAANIIAKPFTPEELVRGVNRVIG